jgi:DNA-binding Lrp family transcriptional regulator
MVPVVDSDKAGFPFCAVIALAVRRNSAESILKMLASREEVVWVANLTGRIDILFVAHFRSTHELSEFLHNVLAPRDEIIETETFVCLRLHKGQHWYTPDVR